MQTLLCINPLYHQFLTHSFHDRSTLILSPPSFSDGYHFRANIPNTLIKSLIFVSIIATGMAPPTVNLHNYNAVRL